jgi:DNA-binding NarL/FixJ family response regulator
VLDAARAADGDGPDPTALTPKQLQVIHLVAQGHSNRDVATELGVAETTVRTHLREVYARLEVGSRTAAVAEARRRRLI